MLEDNFALAKAEKCNDPFITHGSHQYSHSKRQVNKGKTEQIYLVSFI